MMLTSGAATAANNKPAATAGVSSPQISLMLEPYTADGQMRLYQVPQGVSYWTNDLPIYRGDQVKLDVFVATGADSLQELKVRVDNQLVADITHAPWTTTLSTEQLGKGYHYVEAWAQVSGPKPQFATRTLTFLVSPDSEATRFTAVSLAPVTQVKGKQQILSNGQVVDVPLAPNAAPVAPSLPTPVASGSRDGKATVNVVLSDAALGNPVTTTAQSPLLTPALATIVPITGSTAQNFVYAITRGSQVIQSSDHTLAADATRIRLQPRNASTEGLLPGADTLWVWGVDPQGNYGDPVATQVQIGTPVGS